MTSIEQVAQDVRTWLEQVVIGLNLCPFARTPYQNGRVRIVVTEVVQKSDLRSVLREELERLEQTSAEELETTIVVVPGMLQSFGDYNQFLDVVDAIIERGGWYGTFQAASFHPQYQFAGTARSDRGNFTNRAPWPLIHLLREASIEHAVAHYPDPDTIPQRNIQQMRALSAEEIHQLFPWNPCDLPE